MNRLIKVKCQGNYYKLINKLKNLSIIIYEIASKDDWIYLKIAFKDYHKLRKYLPSYHFIMDQELGLGKALKVIKNYYYYFISLIIGLGFLIFLSNIIVKVEVIHSSKEIRDLLYDALDDEGIRRLTFKKNYEELSHIKEKILNKYQNDLEWLEIESKGMKYIVRVEQRIITKEKNNPQSCHIIAQKSGVITDILTVNGEALVQRGNYVSKGDVLISGNISFNNETKNTVCEKGTVKAEIWYTVKVSMPLKYEEKSKTGQKRFNFVYDKGLGKTNIFRNRLKTFESKDKKILSLLGVNYYFRTMEEYKQIVKRYSPEEALNAATLLALEKINIQKKDLDKIIAQKVLKKEINDSTINLEIFFAIEEEIGKQEEFLNSKEVE